MRASTLFGMPVVDRHGRPLGTVSDLLLDDPAPATICYLLVNTAPAEGAACRTVAVPWRLVSPGEQGDAIKLGVSGEALRQMRDIPPPAGRPPRK
ncbi:PRC-barrel domain-containing protein [Thioalkalivibrio sp. XN279]|uniref:PRC-barrel domain-containing protein n=1 Tax=Thioalkalivibrio sp. XN279 TaxID=2714953 RepID=UPI00140B5BD1|nr:PRC-barrel domain-containing protein [Thioalkalivibrio sp. XN279]NHA14768.1 PRC-barrel domain containing protein [Thioalkalivibrio sp. XN279]